MKKNYVDKKLLSNFALGKVGRLYPQNIIQLNIKKQL